MQVYDKDGRQLPATGLHANLPQEVFELKKSFPSVDFEALFTALAVSDNNVDVAKAVSLCCNIISTPDACCSPPFPELQLIKVQSCIDSCLEPNLLMCV